MGYRSLLLALLLVTGVLRAATKPADASPPPAANGAREQKKADTGKKETSRPLPPFTPSEKIKADSAVAFPVDI